MQIPPKPLPIVRDLQGNVITPVDLPDPTTVRWTPNKKAIVVRAIRAGLVSLQETLNRYGMRERELLIWEKGLSENGKMGLKVTHYQRLRKAKKTPQIAQSQK